MTKTFLKWAVLLFTALTFSVAFVSCDEDDKPVDPENPENPDQPENPEKPGEFTFILNEKNVEIPAEGGAGKVTYTLENPIEGEQIKVEEEAEWLTDLSTATANEITFKVAANDSYEPRVTDVKVTYSTKETLFTVRQQGKEMPKEDKFKIEISNITETQYDVVVTPFDNSISYAANVLTKEVYDKYESDEDLIIKDLEWYEYLAGINNMTLEQVLPKILHKGVYDEHMVENLANTDYVYFAYGLTYDAEPTTEVYVKPFKTAEVEMIEADFDITVTDIAKGTATVNVVPKRNEVSYFYEIMSKKDYEKVTAQMTLEEYTQAFLTDVMRKAYIFDQTWEQALQEVVTMGPDSYTYEGVISNDVCIAYAMAVDEEGQVCSKAKVIEWETYHMEMSNNEIKGEILDVRGDRCTIRWTPSTQEPYCVVYSETSKFEGKTDKEKLDFIVKYFGKELIYTGTQEMLQMWLTPETSYSFFAFGWDGELTTDTMTEVVVVTTGTSDPSTLKFEFEISNLSYKTATVACSGNPDDAAYIFGLASARATADDVKEDLKLGAEVECGKGDKGWMEFIQRHMVRGRYSNTYAVFQNLEYKPYAVGIYEKTGEYATEIIFGDTFKVPEGIRSDADIDVVWDKYYHVDAVYEAFPESEAQYHVGTEKCLLPFETIVQTKHPETNPDNWFFTYTALFDESVEQLNDDEVIYYISNISSVFRHNERYLEYDTKYWIVAVAQEWGTNYTKLIRKEVNLSKSGVSPLGDFVPAGDYDPQSASAGVMSFDFRRNANPFMNAMFSVANGNNVDLEKIDRVMNNRNTTANAVEEQVSDVNVRSDKMFNKNGKIAKIENVKSLNAAEKALMK